MPRRTRAFDLRDLFHPLNVETFDRPLRVKKLEVVDGHPATPQESVVGVPGSIVLILARAGSDVINRARAAATEGGADAAREFSDRLLAQYQQRRSVPLEQGIQMVIHEPVFAEFRYAGQMLSQHLFVPEGLDAAVFVFRYYGGRIADEGFTLAERYQRGTDVALEGLVIRREPPMTGAERAALNNIPDDELLNQVGRRFGVRQLG